MKTPIVDLSALELLPCPWCGALPAVCRIEAHDHTPMLKALMSNIDPAEDTYWVECYTCGGAKSGCNTEAEAIAAWNRRTPDLALARRAEKDEWQDISTAPRDGTRVLLWTDTDNDEDRDYVEMACEGEHFSLAQIGWYDGGWSTYIIGQPTHWRPLPEPPCARNLIAPVSGGE